MVDVFDRHGVRFDPRLAGCSRFVRHSDYAELEAEVERLTKELLRINAEFDELCREKLGIERVGSTEALSRTGSVKVSREDVAKMVYEGMSWAAMCGPTPNGTVPVWEDRGNSLGQDEARRIADRILSALEPAAPEIGSMEAYNAATKAMAARMANTAILVGDSEPAAPEGQQPVAGAVRVCPVRDAICPHGMGCLYNNGMDCDMEASRADLAYQKHAASYTRPSEQAVTEATHHHKKRGTEYVLIGIGKMQSQWWFEPSYPIGEPVSVDMREVAIYRSVDDGSLWVRPREEFEDGRFEVLKAAMEAGRHE